MRTSSWKGVYSLLRRKPTDWGVSAVEKEMLIDWKMFTKKTKARLLTLEEMREIAGECAAQFITSYYYTDKRDEMDNYVFLLQQYDKDGYGITWWHKDYVSNQPFVAKVEFIKIAKRISMRIDSKPSENDVENALFMELYQLMEMNCPNTMRKE